MHWAWAAEMAEKKAKNRTQIEQSNQHIHNIQHQSDTLCTSTTYSVCGRYWQEIRTRATLKLEQAFLLYEDASNCDNFRCEDCAYFVIVSGIKRRKGRKRKVWNAPINQYASNHNTQFIYNYHANTKKPSGSLYRHYLGIRQMMESV